IGSLSSVQRRVGVDISPRAIAFAQAFHPEVEFRAQDAAELSETFDVVLAAEVLEHIPDAAVAGFLKTLEGLAKSHGHVVVSVPSIVQKLNKKHYRHYSAQSLAEEVQRCAPQLHLERLEEVFAPARWFKWLAKRTCNKNFVLEMPALNRCLLRHALGPARVGAPGTGRHLVAVFKRPPVL
ncbi:MAG: methyltransferase domain-containing protein, partial [Steroidobacteraceae bacterium]